MSAVRCDTEPEAYYLRQLAAKDARIAELEANAEAQRSLIEAGERLRFTLGNGALPVLVMVAREAYDAAAARVKGTT